jgi:O-antigen/teichoic acid export membrane protein
VGTRAKFRWGLLGAVALIGFAGYQYAHNSPTLALLFIIAGLALPFMESLSLYASYFNGTKRFSSWALADIVSQAISTGALIGTLLLTKSIPVLMVAYFIPYIISRACIYYIARPPISNSKDDGELVSYGQSLTLLQVITRTMASLDQIVLYHFMGAAQVAIFSLAVAVPNRIQSVFKASGSLAFPKFANQEPREIARSLPRKMVFFLLFVLATCATYVLVAPFLFIHVFPKYFDSISFSQIAIFYTISAITYPFGSYLFAHKKLRDNYTIAIGGFIIKAFCLALFVPLYGIWGAIIGLLSNSVLTLVLTFWMLARDARA